jgi:eukaryotic-like serine/threonine-protein kinase
MGTMPQVLLGRYEVGRLLGAGGMAEVYEGHDRLLARRVAIKVLLAQYAHDPAFLARFRREAQAAASLSHPNIVAVFDTGSQDDTWFIVMEYVAGRTLKDVINTEGPAHPARAAEICADVASALASAHARGIVHRDVKPANVMLTADGKVKVMDFGIARASAVPSITQTAAVVGTAQYIAPEQAQGLEADARSDLYALGCCLYEMLTGQVPFTGPTPVAIAYRHVQEDPVSPRALKHDVPVSLERVCLKAMAKRPEDRYQTAMEMRQDLERARTGAPVTAGIPLASQHTRTMGDSNGSVADAPTTVLDPRTAVTPVRAARAGGAVGAPAQDHPRRWRMALFVLATLTLGGIVAWVVVRAVEVPPVPSTTLPPITTLTPEGDVTSTSEQLSTTSSAPPTTEQATSSTATQSTSATTSPNTTLSPVVTVPNVIGQRVGRATENLQNAGLKVSRQNVPVTDRSRVNRVVNQLPRGGQQVPRNSTVVILVGEFGTG